MKRFHTIFITLFILFSLNYLNAKTIMIHPAGGMHNPGRRLVEGYERGVTLSLAEFVQQGLNELSSKEVLLTRKAGEELPFLHYVSRANRLCVNTFISLHVYRHDSPKPTITFYHLLYHPLIDRAPIQRDPFEMVPLYEAHFGSSHVSEMFCKLLHHKLLEEPYAKQITSQGVIGLPLRHLIGLTSPAFACEIGLKHDSQWQTIAPILVEAFSFLNQPLASD
jgi:N-acetylmuramoyl-L-alanine amidase